jgi:predicted ArsR family transcriptional regulator
MQFPGEATERVARSLIDAGPATSVELAERLGMTPPAVRKHLRQLGEAGLVEARDRAPFGPAPKRGRGRPSPVYVITDAGRSAARAQDSALGVDVLRFMERTHGTAAVEAFAQERAAVLADEWRRAIAAHPGDEIDAVRDSLTDAGYAASVEVVADGPDVVQLCQHHCPVVDAAAEFPQLCEAETEALGAVLGRHVTRLATLAHGDGICTTLIPTNINNRREVHA